MTKLGIPKIMACCLQIIHLDLKSHNILLGRGGVAKIADVGLAKIMSKSATRASATGTFDWAAPGTLTTCSLPPPALLSFTHLTTPPGLPTTLPQNPPIPVSLGFQPHVTDTTGHWTQCRTMDIAANARFIQ